MNKILIIFVTVSSLCSLTLAFSSNQYLIADRPIVLDGASGKFDFMGVDPSMARILAAHRGTKTLEMVDLKTGKPLKSVEVGAAQGVAVDMKEHRYFLGNEAEQSIAFVDSQSLTKVAEFKVDGPVDAIAFDEKNGILYAAQDDGDHLWVINAKQIKLVGTVAIPGAPEVLEFDSDTNHLYLNIKNKNTVVRIDPVSNRIDATWSTLPATSPHGLALDSKRGRVYTAGGNGKLVAIDFKTGKVISTAEISEGVDQIAYDVDKQLIYSACKGFISITKASDGGLKALGKVISPKGAHTLAVDPISHAVWVSFADEKHSYLQSFKFVP